MEDAGGVGGVAAFGIGCAIDYPAYLRPADGTCTHGAGFDGDVERSVGEVFAAECPGGGRYGLHLGVRGDILEGLGEVMSAADDLVLGDDNTTDGDLVGVEGFLGFGEGEAHEALVVIT